MSDLDDKLREQGVDQRSRLAVDNIQNRFFERVANNFSLQDLSEELILEALRTSNANYGCVLRCDDVGMLVLDAAVSITIDGTVSCQQDDLLAKRPDRVMRDVIELLKPTFSNNPSDLDLINLPRSHPSVQNLAVCPLHDNGTLKALLILINAQPGFDLALINRLQSMLDALIDRLFNSLLDAVDTSNKRYEGDTNEPLFKLLKASFTDLQIAEKQHESLKRQISRYDPLTGLPNRTCFLEHLHDALDQRNGQNIMCLLFINLDGFKAVNDTLGHETGDELLQQVAMRLRQSMPDDDPVARLGGDEFAIILRSLEHHSDASDVADAILLTIKRPFVLKDEQVYVSASIGIATACGFSRNPAADANSLIKQADIALYRAKLSGRSRHVFFTPELDQAQRERAILITSLRRAVDHKDFELFYQPQVLIKENHLLGFEALLRWPQRAGGHISPDAFIEVLEDTGLIGELGEWAISEACAQHRNWLQQGLIGPATTMSVNVSARQLSTPHFAEQVATILQRCSMRPDSLILEITESTLVQTIETDIIRQIKALGIQISLDDFGTGYSSLAYLSQLPLDHLKIDRSFIADIERYPHAITVVKSIIALANTLGIRVIAEGVESATVLPLLASEGCEIYQGFHFSEPLPASQMAARLRQMDKVRLSHYACFIDLGERLLYPQ